MTVSSSVNKVTYSGNSATTVFPVNYYFLENSHLQVILVSNNVETIQTITSQYTVTGAGNPAGGSVTMLTPPPTGTQLIIVRNVPATQETDYLANDPFPAESHERALDKLTMLVQQNSTDIDRALKIPLSSLATTSTELPVPSANKLLAWNSNASAVTNFDPASVISIVGQQASFSNVFTGNGVTVNFTLDRTPGNANAVDVSINGVTQVPNVDYILNGDILTFTTAPPQVASQILARYTEVFAEPNGDAANVRYVPAGSGAVATNVQAKLRETVSVKDFGAVGDGVTDDTVAIQAAHNTGNLIFYPTGTYLFTSDISITSGGIVGEGITETILKSNDATSDNLINYVGNYATNSNVPLFSNFKIIGNLAKTSGAALSVNPPTDETEYLYFTNVTFENVPTGIEFQRASLWKITNCNFLAYTIAGVLVRNLNVADAGDSVIIGCVFNNPFTTGSGILQQSSGGLKVIGNKFLGGNSGYTLSYDTTAGGTSILIIANNSIEQMASAGIVLANAAGSVSFLNIIIANNQFGVQPRGISVDAGILLTEFSVTGNVFNLAGSPGIPSAISANDLDRFLISNNLIRGNGGASVGVSLVNCSNGIVGLNKYSNLATIIAESGSTNVEIVKSAQSGVVTTSTSGWTAYGTLFQSATITVTFPVAFNVAPSIQDIQFSFASSAGEISVIVVSSSTTQMQFRVISCVTDVAATVYWKAFGLF
jgi:hypothetical protein